MNIQFLFIILFSGIISFGAEFNKTLDLKIIESAKSGDSKALLQLLSENGNPNATDSGGVNAVYYAAKASDSKALEVLQKKGADLNVKAGSIGITPLMASALSNNLSSVKFLLSQHVDVNSVDSEGATALHIASRQGNLEVAKALVKAHAKKDLPDIHGNTPLINSVIEGKTALVKFLVKSGAKTQIKNLSGQTAQDIAGDSKQLEIFSYLQKVKKENQN